jgi:hypothetical protein
LSSDTSTFFRFSTEGTTRSPLAALRELNDRNLVLRLDPLPGRDVRADIVVHSRLPLRIMEATVAGVRHSAAPAGGAGGDELLLATTRSGASLLRQRSREIALADGAAVLLRRSDGPLTLTHFEPVQFLGLRIDADAVRPLLGDLDAALMRLTPRRSGVLGCSRVTWGRLPHSALWNRRRHTPSSFGTSTIWSRSLQAQRARRPCSHRCAAYAQRGCAPSGPA